MASFLSELFCLVCAQSQDSQPCSHATNSRNLAKVMRPEGCSFLNSGLAVRLLPQIFHNAELWRRSLSLTAKAFSDKKNLY